MISFFKFKHTPRTQQYKQTYILFFKKGQQNNTRSIHSTNEGQSKQRRPVIAIIVYYLFEQQNST